ncbi:MAG: efflux RND transporter periplasmic adaptor subunit [Spirochaetes bacterium]|nr:efflux RND transporter periplasmic adaptor subunit [Spirochaetota bacterium]
MKKTISRSLPYAIITIVIVLVGASIVFKELGLSFARKSSHSGKGLTAQLSAPSAGPGSGGKQSIAVRAETITSGSVNNYTTIHGDVVVNNETKIYPNVGGKLLERNVSIGSQVSKGTTLALVDPSKPGESYLPNPIESTVSGTVLSIPVHEGDTITANTVIATVGNLSRFKIGTAVPERYLANLRIGTSAQIRFDAIPGVVYAARVSEMSPVVDASSRTLDISLELDRSDPRILVGMFATVKLITESRTNVVTAPRVSVILSSTEASVYIVKDGNTVERRTVVLGLEGEDSFEVKQGLKPGEKVVTEGKSSVSDGDSVRIVDGEAGVAK